MIIEDERTTFRTSSGISAGMEGACFFNPYVGVCGRWVISGTSIVVNGNEAVVHAFDALLLSADSYFPYPLSARWLVGCKFLRGYVHYPQLNLPEKSVSARNGMGGCGVSLTSKAKEHYGIRFFLIMTYFHHILKVVMNI